MRRRGFTLIELLVVMGIIAVLSTMIIAFAPAFGDRQRASRGASMLQGWLNLAKQRAIRDRRPVGIRLPAINGNYITEVQYVEIPDEGIGGTMTVPFAANYPPSSANYPTTYQCVLFTTTVPFSPDNPQVNPPYQFSHPSDPHPEALIRADDVIEFPSRPLANYASRRIATGGTLAPDGVLVPSKLQPQPQPPVPNSFTSNGVTYYNYFVQLDQSLPAAGFSTPTFVVSRKARPVVGEPVLQLPKDIAIDLSFDRNTSPPTWYRMFPPLANTGGSSPFDILFSPAGQVIGNEGNLGSRICLWVRDVSLNDPNPPAGFSAIYQPSDPATDPRKLPPAVNTLITVYTRTGHVTSHPIDPNGLVPNTPPVPPNPVTWNPFSFTQDGLTSGNAGN
jgi:prepilin-type N-terminal cleavage/methylation domain-containing protein